MRRAATHARQPPSASPTVTSSAASQIGGEPHDAPTAAVNTVRAVLAQLQQQAMEQAQQQRQAQQQAMQQAQQAARRAAQGGGVRGPVQLPDPDFRLPEPGLR